MKNLGKYPPSPRPVGTSEGLFAIK